ncbi:unnamed protein product [Blepharisma stoltei]|uniref:Ribosomal protein S15 n=1 Tax=Blepharisma stoltei TaxID=1481888 RepID=A0AAU9I9L7_9CILI|nr:unnamed protein product [Blepharisma stoltei]
MKNKVDAKENKRQKDFKYQSFNLKLHLKDKKKSRREKKRIRKRIHKILNTYWNTQKLTIELEKRTFHYKLNENHFTI